MANFGPRSWTNPFGKMSTFFSFGTFRFYSIERRFFVLEYHKTYFPNLYIAYKKAEKMANI